MLCYSCNHVYHRKCHTSLPNRGTLPGYWQCDICVQEEHAKYDTSMTQLRPPMVNNNARDADADEKYDEYQQDMANDPETEDINNDEEYVILPNESRNPARVAGGRRTRHSRPRNKKPKSITTMLDDPADDDTDDSDTEQPSQKIQIMDFFKKK